MAKRVFTDESLVALIDETKAYANNVTSVKANSTDLTNHIEDNSVHVTSNEKENWNDANSKKHEHSNKSVLDGITSALITAWNNAVTHISDTVKHITSTERTNWTSAYTHSTSAHAPSNAEANQNAFSNVVVGSTTISADSKTDSLTLVAGSNVTLTPDATNDKITIAATDTVYTHPNSGVTAGEYAQVTVDSQGHVTSGKTMLPQANIKSYVHSAVGASGTAGYVLIATIKIKANYAGMPLVMELVNRGTTSVTPKLYIRFKSADTSDPVIETFGYTDKNPGAYLHKSATSTWDLYVQKSEAWDSIDILRYHRSEYLEAKLDLTWKNVHATALPDGATAATHISPYASASHGTHVPATCTSITDWNSATATGWYMASNATNAPSENAWYFGYVIAHNANYVIQEVYQFTAASDASIIPKYIRVKQNGTWGAWKNVTVSKAVPSDAKFTDTVYTHPTTSGNKHIPSGGSSGQILRWSADGTAVWGADNNTTYNVATTTANGLMSSSDKTKLNNVICKSCVVGQSSSTTTNPWYKVASVVMDATYTDYSITFKVSTGYGNTANTHNGILTAHARTGNNKNFESGDLVWEYAGSGVVIDNYILAYKDVANTSCTIELWTKIDVAYTHRHFEVLTEHDRTSDMSNVWTLHNLSSAGSSSGIPTDYTRITSKLMSLLNSATYSVATTSANGLMSSTDKSKLDYSNIAYATCSSTADTVAKVASILGNSNWSLKVGSIVAVKFTVSNTASNVTLNVNSTGAKSIWYNNAVYTGSSTDICGYANRHVLFMYDGTYWVFLAKATDNNNTYTPATLGQGYGTCSTAEATTAKVVTLSNYTLVTGGIVAVKFTYAVPASATMNINSKGAKAIYNRGAAIAANVIKAGDIATFIYNGSQYHLLTVDRDNNTTYSVVTASANGLVPMFDAADGTIDSSSTDWVLTNNNGSIGWYKLPANAFNNTTYNAATTSANGLMTSDMVTKLNGIEAGANKYSLPTASSTLGGVKTTSTVTSTSGLTACPIISGVPYYKDTVYTHPTTAGNKHIPSGGSSGQVLTWSSSGTATWANPSAGNSSNVQYLPSTDWVQLKNSSGSWVNWMKAGLVTNYLFNNGLGGSDIPLEVGGGGWNYSSSTSAVGNLNSDITSSDTSIVLQTTGSSQCHTMGTKNKINLTMYSTLHAEFTWNSTTTTLEVDLTAISGSAYVGVALVVGASDTYVRVFSASAKSYLKDTIISQNSVTAANSTARRTCTVTKLWLT